MPDRYMNFSKLSANKREGVDFRICLIMTNSPVAIIAPHGGTIERGTSEVAKEIAGTSYSLYLFEGLINHPHGHFHITSTNFDEPRCNNLVRNCEIVIAVHGLRGQHKAV